MPSPGRPRRSVVSIFLRAAADLCRRVLRFVVGELPRGCLEQVDVEAVGDPDEIDEDVGEFVWKKLKRRPLVLPVVVEV